MLGGGCRSRPVLVMLILMLRTYDDTLIENNRYIVPTEQATALIQLGYAEAIPELAARQPATRKATIKRGVRR